MSGNYHKLHINSTTNVVGGEKKKNYVKGAAQLESLFVVPRLPRANCEAEKTEEVIKLNPLYFVQSFTAGEK